MTNYYVVLLLFQQNKILVTPKPIKPYHLIACSLST